MGTPFGGRSCGIMVSAACRVRSEPDRASAPLAAREPFALTLPGAAAGIGAVKGLTLAEKLFRLGHPRLFQTLDWQVELLLTMTKKLITSLMVPLLLLFCNSSQNSVAGPKESAPDGQTGTLQKMIVADGNVTMNVDLNRLNGISSATGRPETLEFTVAANSFFPVLVFNNVLRGAQQGGSLTLIPRTSAALPAALSASLNQLVVERLASGEAFDLAVRDGKTGFVFFNVDRHQYDYDAKSQSLNVNGGRLLISTQFAEALGRPSEAGLTVGEISIGASMKPIEVETLVNGTVQSAVMPAVGTQPGPDVIVGDLPSVEQFGSVGTQVGLAVGTDSCNNGQVDLDWFALPNNDHPVIPQNLYKMSGGTSNNERFEQIGQSWLKHAFAAASSNTCGFGCNGVGGSHLGSGCSDLYSAGLNAGQNGLGSRGWVNPFTGNFPGSPSPADHTGHVHTGTSHRVTVAMSELDVTQNPGATYFAEAQYVTPHEYSWCQTNPGECNMFNNVSYRQFSVSGVTSFTFSPVGSTVRMTPAIYAWDGATINQIEPDPGNDGIAFVGYKVTNPSTGVWHYEYAIYNENLDRAIQSFAVPTGRRVRNIGFRAPSQEPGWANDGTVGNAGYSSTPWTSQVIRGSLTWSCETLAQNPNANAIRWGTLYNFRFDSPLPPQDGFARIGFFKTGAPILVPIQAPQLPHD